MPNKKLILNHKDGATTTYLYPRDKVFKHPIPEFLMSDGRYFIQSDRNDDHSVYSYRELTLVHIGDI